MMIKDFFIAIAREYHDRLKQISYLERFFWLIIVLLILSFGFKLGIVVLSSVIALVIVFGVVVIDKDKSIALTITTLLFVIWTFSIQQRQLNSQVEGLKNQFQALQLDEKVYETAFRPYVGVEKIKPIFTRGQIKVKVIIKNYGAVPANSMEITHFYHIEGVSPEDINRHIPEAKAILFPHSDWVYEPYMVGPNEKVDEITGGTRKLKFEIVISYDGIRTKNHRSEYMFVYDNKDNSLGIEKAFAD